MALTEKRRKFCREYIANGGQLIPAYRAAFPNKESDSSIQANGHRLLDNPEVQEYLEYLRKPLELAAINERQQKRDILWDWINDSSLPKKERMRALDMLNKMDGEYSTNLNVNDTKSDISKLDTDALMKLIGNQ